MCVFENQPIHKLEICKREKRENSETLFYKDCRERGGGGGQRHRERQRESRNNMKRVELGFHGQLNCLLLQVPTAGFPDSVFVALFRTIVEGVH